MTATLPSETFHDKERAQADLEGIGTDLGDSPAGRWSRVRGKAGLVFFGTFVLLGIVGPWIAPHSPIAISRDFVQGPSSRHLLGTNQIGQDLASQMLVGARSSLYVAALAGTGTVVLGALVGMLAGWWRGWFDMAVMRVIDVFLATPRLPLLILLGLYAGRDLWVVVLIIILLFWPGTARAVRSQVLSLRRRVHIKASVGFGSGALEVLRRHIVPEMSLILVAQVLSAMGRAVMLEAGLAFLGIGDPQRTSWGSVMREAQGYAGLVYSRAYLWWMVPPVLSIVITLLGLSFLGTTVEQRINPRLARHHAGRA